MNSRKLLLHVYTRLFAVLVAFGVFGSLLDASEAHAAVRSCRAIFTPSQGGTAFPEELIKISGQFVFKDFTIEGGFDRLNRSRDYKDLLEKASSSAARLHGKIDLPESLGGGSLRLVRLSLQNGNRPYNHQELVALLKVHPQLANRIGFFEVPNYPNLVWVPDIVQMNHRLDLIAKEQGFSEAIWRYAIADGVVQYEPYIAMLSSGRFPFAWDKELNLTVHDVMHSAAFAVLNSTPTSRKVMKVSLKRAQIVERLYSKIKTEFPELRNSFEKHAGLIVSDGLEKTMLLSILLTGNYNYFSVTKQLENQTYFVPQNKDVTILRVKNLMKLFAQGNINFKKLFQLLNKRSLSDERLRKLEIFFQEAIDQLGNVTESDLSLAATEIVERTFPPKIFSRSQMVRQSQEEAGTTVDTFDPSNRLDSLISEGEEPIR